MSHTTDRDGFRIEWDLHELGPKPQQPTDPPATLRLAIARALAAGDVAPNAAEAEQQEAA